MRRGAILAFAVGLTTALSTHAQQVPTPPDERGLWQVWQTHTNRLDQHDIVIAACRDFETARPRDPFITITRGIAVWHLLKQNQQAEARDLLNQMLSVRDDSPIGRAGANMARAWLTRLDREDITEALRRHYARNVAYPESLTAILEALPPARRPPSRDAWNEPWRYRLGGFRILSGLENQRYVLESRTLGHRSDLAEALSTPYAHALGYTPVRRVGRDAAVAFAPPPGDDGDAPGEQRIATVGSRLDLAVFAFMGRHLIVLADPDHWNILGAP